MRLFRRAKVPLRYFLYVSDAKLDMLFEQIDPDLRRHLSAEAKVDLKIASLTLRQGERSQAARIAKLRMVEQYIGANHDVGTISSPGQQYFRGSTDMSWGWLSHGPDDKGAGRSETVFFRGGEGSDLVMLAGSRRYVLGQHLTSLAAEVGMVTSNMPAILAVIAASYATLGKRGLYQRGHYLGKIPAISGLRNEAPAVQHPSEETLREAASISIPGPAQRLEFLAVPLIQGTLTAPLAPVPAPNNPDFAPVHAVLGTPIYVAMALQAPPIAPSAPAR